MLFLSDGHHRMQYAGDDGAVEAHPFYFNFLYIASGEVTWQIEFTCHDEADGMRHSILLDLIPFMRNLVMVGELAK